MAENVKPREAQEKALLSRMSTSYPTTIASIRSKLACTCSHTEHAGRRCKPTWVRWDATRSRCSSNHKSQIRIQRLLQALGELVSSTDDAAVQA